MIFKPELARQVARGSKTQTRRRVKSNEGTCRYQIGRDYAVQPGRGQKQIARVTISAVRSEPLGEVTLEDARAEGFRTRADFADYWMALYDRDWPILEEQFCGRCAGWGHVNDESCEPCDGIGAYPQPARPSDEKIIERFMARHADRQVWVIEFTLSAPDRDIFLAHPGPNNGDYTHNRERSFDPDTPVTVTPTDLERYARENRKRHEERTMSLEQQRQHLQLEEQLRQARHDAAAGGIDITRLENVIQAKIEAIRRKTRKRAA
jgi:uncharacterized protein YhfF